jgi:hypothetical protein
MPTKITGELRGQMWPAGSRVIMLGAHLVPPTPRVAPIGAQRIMDRL